MTKSVKKFKPALIDWIIERFKIDIKYSHSYKDQFISFNIWNGTMWISFDNRQPEQVKLFSLIPDSFKGTPQYKTGKMVNLNSLYLNLDTEFEIIYPKIEERTIIGKVGYIDNDGDTFFIYTWRVNLDDGTYLDITNQNEKILDIEEFIYPTKIQERFILNLLCPQQIEGY